MGEDVPHPCGRESQEDGLTTATKTGNPVERIKAEKPGLDILDEIHDLAAAHGGWETIEPGDRERLKWIGTFFRKPTPGRFMMRLRITNGRLTASQLATLAALARRLGSGVMDLTTRQQVELRDIQIRDVPQILSALRQIDLSSLQTGMDNIRGTNTCAMSGLTPNELFDAAPVGEEFTRMFLGNREYTNLPRKLNVAFTGCLENCIHAETQDIAMTPAIGPGGVALNQWKGFNVAVGGKMGSGGMTVARPLDVFVKPGDAALMAATITLMFRDEGSREKRTRARLAFLLDDWGIEKFRERLEERWGRTLHGAGEDARYENHSNHLGITQQKQKGLYSVGLCVPTGRTCADDMTELARLAAVYGSGDIRLTVDQNAIIAGVPESRLPDLLEEPLLSRLSPDPAPMMRGLVSCTGNDYCNLALIETKSVSRQVFQALDDLYPDAAPLRMYWSGCPAGCGNHHAADIGFQGGKTRFEGNVVDAVTIFAGGSTGPNARPAWKVAEQVPVSTLGTVLPGLIEKLKTEGYGANGDLIGSDIPGIDFEA